jgi:glycosyltransferase involved in cell wall biosynthesis
LCEAVLDGRTGVLYPPGDSQALAGCLENLLDHPELAEQYGKQGRTGCETDLSLWAQKRRFMEVLRRRLA